MTVCAAYGEEAILVDLGDAPSSAERVSRNLRVATAIRSAFPGADVVTGGTSIAIHAPADARSIDRCRRAVDDALATRTTAMDVPIEAHEIEVRYDGADLDEVAGRAGLSVGEVIERHAAATYTVEIVGFAPGFAYLGPIDPRLVLPRRASPRQRVPAGSVAIAGRHTGIYPSASPGGWHLLGVAHDPDLFDADRDRPSRFSVGDRVSFRPSQRPHDLRSPSCAADPASFIGRRSAERAALRIERVGLAMVQDRGRHQRASGVPAGGPIDERLHAAANAACGNDPGTAAIEIILGRLRAVAIGRVAVSIDGSAPRWLADGEELEVGPVGLVAYVATPGGWDTPLILGSRSALSVGTRGVGHVTRGDVLRSSGADAIEPAGSKAHIEAPPANVEIVAGPRARRFPGGALEELVSHERAVSSWSRVGSRVGGPAVSSSGADDALPEPMVRGAIQIATDGTPIVLGPDHGTTGGYPVLAVLTRQGRATFARLLPNAPFRFVLRSEVREQAG